MVVERYPNVTGISEIMINTCAAKLPPGITAQKLDACAKGPLGQQLIGEARAETDALVPKHTYVPWVTIDDKPIYNNLSNISAGKKEKTSQSQCDYHTAPLSVFFSL